MDFSGIAVFVNGWNSYDDECQYGETECGRYCCSECCIDDSSFRCGYDSDCDDGASLITIVLSFMFVGVMICVCCYCYYKVSYI